MPHTIVQMLDFVPNADRSMECFLLALATKLRAQNWRTVHVFAGEPGESFKNRLKELDSPYLVARFQPTVSSARALGKQLRQYQPDVLQVTFMSTFGFALPALKWAMKSRALVVADHSSGYPRRRQGPRQWLTRARGILARGYIDRVIAVSDFVRSRDAHDMNLGEKKVHRVYNGIDVNKYAPMTTEPRPTPVIAYAGRLIPEKGVDTLLRALCPPANDGLPACQVMIAGRGAQEAELKAFCQTNGLSQVQFLGQIDYIARLFASADVVVVPSIYGEAFGFTPAEAMACGACVIGSDAGAIPEVIGESGHAGIIFRRGDAQELAAKLKSALSDPAARRAMGHAARLRVVEKFTIDRMVDGYISILRDLVQD